MEIRISIEETINSELYGGGKFENVKPRFEVVIDTAREIESQIAEARATFKKAMPEMMKEISEFRAELSAKFNAQAGYPIKTAETGKSKLSESGKGNVHNVVLGEKERSASADAPDRAKVAKPEGAPQGRPMEGPSAPVDPILPTQKSALRGLLGFKPMDAQNDVQVFAKLGIISWDNLTATQARTKIPEVQKEVQAAKKAKNFDARSEI